MSSKNVIFKKILYTLKTARIRAIKHLHYMLVIISTAKNH